ncbi:MAG TPA: hypothetical protein VG227_07530 [Caulobacteraceae bacterium]|nr:hypothetical protein [Caulobacteraceae bacterium]
MRRLIGVALALAIVGGAGQAVGKPPAHPSAQPATGVTTLEPAGGGAWRPSDDTNGSFTPVGVIGGRSVNADSDPGGPLANITPDVAPAGQAAEPGKAPSVKAMGWLPEPATWLLLLIGLAMIGFALRGLVAARRRLTRLEETETESET